MSSKNIKFGKKENVKQRQKDIEFKGIKMLRYSQSY